MRHNGWVCIIDDDEAVRESLRLLLFASGFKSVQFESADAYLALDDPPEVDVFLLDIRMPGTDGMELHRQLIDRGSRAPVIFITGHGDIPLAVSAMHHGARDFLTKPFEEGELVSKITVAVREFRELRRELGEVARLRARLERLTPRESEVMSRIVGGLSNKQIARDLGISPRTVEIHRSRVMEKMQADSVAALVHMVSLAEASD
ncbi:MAG: response regulator [Xanthomonadales bacterium]|nr:response regulator [Xanthomonadales bacterium]NIN73811.1 response regulator [Xanthomonadales bacterium]NIP10915.1 response regulator [Xanthomonadales bacterium]NIT07219.1 response regulator [Xanthomonadales bacterium]NIT32695.1 response regulator [Xanthomonadales bacterium]